MYKIANRFRSAATTAAWAPLWGQGHSSVGGALQCMSAAAALPSKKEALKPYTAGEGPGADSAIMHKTGADLLHDCVLNKVLLLGDAGVVTLRLCVIAADLRAFSGHFRITCRRMIRSCQIASPPMSTAPSCGTGDSL